MKAVISIASVGILLSIACNTVVEPEAYYRNKILFTSSRSGIEQLYMMNPDGSDVRQITSGPYWHNNGRWSPDAKQIICNTEEGTATAGFMMAVMNPDGRNRQLLRWGSQMAWSPVGAKILFTICLDCELGGRGIGLFIMDGDGGNVARLSIDGGAPEWSPHGDMIALVEPDTTNSLPPQPTIRLTDYPALTSSNTIGPKGAVEPAWSPTGEQIAFSSLNEGYPVNGNPTENIFIMNADGSNVTMVTDFRTGDQCSTPRWSPDGSEIIFLLHSTDASRPSHTMWSVRMDGTNLRKIGNDITVRSADWSKN
ncbi:MAG: hypothetical protein WEB33_12295 [Bacteroidota bacterium]